MCALFLGLYEYVTIAGAGFAAFVIEGLGCGWW
jgi:hypothetical protein